MCIDSLTNIDTDNVTNCLKNLKDGIESVGKISEIIIAIQTKFQSQEYLAAKKLYFENIANNNVLSLPEKMALILNAEEKLREYKNQGDILIRAEEKLNGKINNDIDYDWFNYFLDKTRLVSNDEMKNVWAMILAKESENPDSVSKQLMHVISIISPGEAKIFNQISKYTINIHTDDEQEFAPMIYYDDNIHFYDERINNDELIGLESLGLIKKSSVGTLFFNLDNVKKDVFISYGEYDVKCDSSTKSIEFGPVSYTRIGLELYNLLDKEIDSEFYRNVLNKDNM